MTTPTPPHPHTPTPAVTWRGKRARARNRQRVLHHGPPQLRWNVPVWHLWGAEERALFWHFAGLTALVSFLLGVCVALPPVPAEPTSLTRKGNARHSVVKGGTERAGEPWRTR